MSLKCKSKIREAYWEAHPMLRLIIEEPKIVKELISHHKKYSFDDNDYNKIKKSVKAKKVLKENIMYILKKFKIKGLKYKSIDELKNYCKYYLSKKVYEVFISDCIRFEIRNEIIY